MQLPTDLTPITSVDQLTDEERVLAVAYCVQMADQLRGMARVWDDFAFELENPKVTAGSQVTR